MILTCQERSSEADCVPCSSVEQWFKKKKEKKNQPALPQVVQRGDEMVHPEQKIQSNYGKSKQTSSTLLHTPYN